MARERKASKRGLSRLMAAQGFYTGDADGGWDAADRRRWELFLGSENYDNRINGGALLDLEVLADLRRRYGFPVV